MNRGPVTQEQIDAWAEYQRARADLGLLTVDEYEAVIGHDHERFEAQR